MAVYACSDLHGQYNLWQQIKDKLKDDDILFFLGDAIDRGQDGIKIMQELLDDKRVIYIMGNHELDFLDYIDILHSRGIYENNLSNFSYNSVIFDKPTIELINYNGTKYTLIDYLWLTPQEQIELKEKLKNKLEYNYTYINKDNKEIFLCHSGCNPVMINTAKYINDFTGNRKHIQDNIWNKNFENTYIVHGHTPVQLLYMYGQNKTREMNMYSYCEGHKIDIDLGAFASDKTVLLNLDTFEPIYIYQNQKTRTLRKEYNNE